MKRIKLTAKNKSLILSGLACVGVALTGYLSAKSALKAEERETKKDKVLAFVPAIVSGSATVLCIGASTYFSGEEIAALTMTCAAMTQKFSDYRKAVNENASPENVARIDEAFYIKEIERLEQELAEREHPREDDDLCIFVDSYSPYTFRAVLEDVEEGIEKAKALYKEQGYLPWCDVFYFLNDGDTNPSGCRIGGEDEAPWAYGGVGWSQGMMEEMYKNEDNFDFDISLIQIKPGAYKINYSVEPEFCYLEH